MKRFELILGIPLVIKIALSVLFLPMGGALGILLSMVTTFAPLILAFIYLIFGAAFFNNLKLAKLFDKRSFQGIGKNRIWGGIFAGISLFLPIYYVTFKVQAYPTSQIIFYLGIIPCSIILFISIYKYFKTKSKYYTRIITRIVAVCTIAIVFFNISESEIRKFKFRNYPEYIKAYEKWEAQPENDSLFHETKRVFDSLFLSPEDYKEMHQHE